MKLLMLILFFPLSFHEGGERKGNCSIRHWKKCSRLESLEACRDILTGTGWQTGSLCHVP